MAKIAVAPLVGAWIEIAKSGIDYQTLYVAPLVGAWIEIFSRDSVCDFSWSLPSWERGLKFTDMFGQHSNDESLPSWERGLKCKWLIKTGWTIESLPSWERGLKSEIYRIIGEEHSVAPLVGAWIEIQAWNPLWQASASLPSWERGLK